MFFIKTEWHDQNPNDWVATDRDTFELIDRDDDLVALAKRIDESGNKDRAVFGKNWFSPHHCAEENRKLKEKCI